MVMAGWILWIVTLLGFGGYFLRRYLMAKKKEERQARDRNLYGHYDQLWDEGPRCMHNVPVDKVTKECAWPVAHCYEVAKPTDQERKVVKK